MFAQAIPDSTGSARELDVPASSAMHDAEFVTHDQALALQRDMTGTEPVKDVDPSGETIIAHGERQKTRKGETRTRSGSPASQ